MPGNIQIQTQIGCDADEVLMTLSGTAEPSGGDHYATIDFTGQSQNKILAGLVSVEWESSPGVWIGVTVQSFLFTSAGETYTLRARGSEILMNWPAIKFPYTVVAIYAPAWASLDGIINGTPTDDCCIPTGESTATNSIWSGNPTPVSSYPHYSNCDPKFISPLTFFSGCAAGADTYSVNVTPSITIYDWVNKSFTTTGTFTYSHVVLGVSLSFTFSFTVTKVSGNSYVTFSYVYSSACDGTLSGSPPDETSDYPGVISITDIPCSLYKIRFSVLSLRFGVSATNLAFIQSNSIAIEFYRP